MLRHTDSYVSPAYLARHDINITYLTPANAPLPGWQDGAARAFPMLTVPGCHGMAGATEDGA